MFRISRLSLGLWPLYRFPYAILYDIAIDSLSVNSCRLFRVSLDTKYVPFSCLVGLSPSHLGNAQAPHTRTTIENKIIKHATDPTEVLYNQIVVAPIYSNNRVNEICHLFGESILPGIDVTICSRVRVYPRHLKSHFWKKDFFIVIVFFGCLLSLF